jgi:predicted ATPase
VRSLVESGALEGDRAAYRLAQPIAVDPAHVQAVLAARIDRVPEREKRLLQLASVIGLEVPERLLAQVSEYSPGALAESLASRCATSRR